MWTQSLATFLPVFFERQRIVAEHEDLVVGRIEFPRRELGEFVVVRDDLEKLLHLRLALARSEARIVLGTAAGMPIDIRRHAGDEGGMSPLPKAA